MAQINKPSDYFNTIIYTGDGTTKTITGVGFQPDFVWGKGRNSSSEHALIDSVRGATKKLASNSTSAEVTNATSYLTGFTSDGYTVDSTSNFNVNTRTQVNWNWLASNTTASNTDGSITSTVSANTTSGFSIVSYTGNGVTGATVGHGLGTAPAMVIVKERGSDTGGGWRVWHKAFGTAGNTDYIFLNQNVSKGYYGADNNWNSVVPTSSIFSLGSTSAVNGNTQTFIAYCFAEKKGFSKFGSFSGNANADGTFVYTGFRPAFIIEKLSSGLASWLMFDNKRDGINGSNNYLYTNETNSESTTQLIDILSNGFKHRHVAGANASGTSIYMAFAENPLVGTNNIPATAR